jgi:hypothetical protein
MEETDMAHLSTTDSPQLPGSAAKALDSGQRQELAVSALSGQQSVSKLAEQHEVSRKFVYTQSAKAKQTLDEAFCQTASDNKVLFYLPVTKAWLRQLVLALVLICHSSLRGVVELLRDLFETNISVGGVHNIVAEAIDKARQHNEKQDLSAVRIGAHDEIFQHRQPVLAGVDADSTYCYLLSLDEQRDGDTWGLHLFDLQERGFAPEAVIADAGQGIRKGQKLALPDIPFRGDVFHGLKMVTELVVYLENRAYDAISACDKLERKQALHERRQGRRDLKLSQQIRRANSAEQQAVCLADEVALLSQWLQGDIFTVAGPSFSDRCVLYDYIVEELRAREKLCLYRIGKLATALTNQRNDLLAFAAQLDRDLQMVADEFEVSLTVVRQILQMQALDPNRSRRWQEQSRLQEQLGSRFYHLGEAVADVTRQTVRASSIIENFNSRLRSYFFLRRHLGPGYLQLLQFFLNHRRFLRSEHPQRVNKSPAELLTESGHPHWLEMLGYQPFSRN